MLLPTRGLPRSRRGFHGCCFQFSHSGCGQELGIEFQHTFGAQVCGDPGDWSKVPRRHSGMQLLGGQGAWGAESTTWASVPLPAGHPAWPACPALATCQGSPELFSHGDSSNFSSCPPGSGGRGHAQKRLGFLSLPHPSGVQVRWGQLRGLLW